MSINLIEVAGANFRTDKNSDSINTDFMTRLGMRNRYLPARLAISRSLAVDSSPPPLDKNTDYGKVIKGDTLFGTGTALSVWTALIIERLDEPDIDIKKLIELVATHWKRGLKLLNEEWTRSGENIDEFVKLLIDVAELKPIGNGGITVDPGTEFVSSGGKIMVPIGEISEEITTREKVQWDLNGPGGSPHSAIMGGVGSGKTRTAVAMLRSIREQTMVPLIAFDFKGDLGTDDSGNGYQIDKVFDAKILEPPRAPIPLDVLHLNSKEPIDISEAASRFRESFARLQSGRLGDIQRNAVHTAATNALSSHSPCEINHIQDALIRVYDESEKKEDGAISAMEEICRFPLFTPTLSPADFFQKSWIIKLPSKVTPDCRTIVVNLMLDALDQHINSLADAVCGADGSRNLRALCLVDEAHHILGSKLPSLSNLIRMSRSKGGAIMLISQTPDDFSGQDDEFLSEMGLVAAFATNAPPQKAARILGKGAKLTSLQTGQCIVKRREDQSSKKVQAWQNQT